LNQIKEKLEKEVKMKGIEMDSVKRELVTMRAEAVEELEEKLKASDESAAALKEEVSGLESKLKERAEEEATLRTLNSSQIE
jgi:hypothetical protein